MSRTEMHAEMVEMIETGRAAKPTPKAPKARKAPRTVAEHGQAIEDLQMDLIKGTWTGFSF